MLKRILIIYLILCAIALVYGEASIVCAQWGGLPKTSQPPQPPPRPILTLPENPLQSPLGNIPSAPKVNTDTSRRDSATGSGNNNSAVEKGREGTRSMPVPIAEPVSPPTAVKNPTPIQVPESSNSKMPWIIVAGLIAIIAFLVGRRTR